MRYVPALDGIRALAVALVLCFHAGVPGMGAGFFGVDVFFVLSGYLITQVLVAEHERTGRIDLPRFYVRRLRRLYPALLAFLAVYLVVALWLPRWPYALHLRDALLSALYAQDYAKVFDYYPAYMRHMWSLSVEEHFYLVWPIALLGVLRLPRQWVPVALLGLFAGLTLWRWAEVQRMAGPEFWQVYNRFDTHATGLVLGCLLGYVRPRLPSYYAPAGLLLLAGSMAYFAHMARDTATYGFTVVELASAMLILAQPSWLGGPVLAWLGRMSYGFYLWHYLIAKLARGNTPWEATLLLAGLGGLAMAALSYYTVEAYFRRRSLPVNDKLVGVNVPVEVRP